MTPEDPTDALVTSLEVMAEEAELLHLPDDEYAAALQTILLFVPELMDEYSAAWAALAELRVLVNKLQTEMAEKQKLWTPHVTLPG